jgi:hypothetical protein
MREELPLLLMQQAPALPWPHEVMQMQGGTRFPNAIIHQSLLPACRLKKLKSGHRRPPKLN